jgi:hypothetical protein
VQFNPESFLAGAVMKFDFDPSQSPGVVKMLAVMRAFRESKREPSIAAINAIVRQALTPEEIADLPPAPEVPGEGKLSDDPVIAWSAFLLWASLRGEL